MNETSVLFRAHFKKWVKTYKAPSVQPITLEKYIRASRALDAICPDLKVSELTRGTYQGILNEYAKTHEKVTVIDFHHQIKGCIKDMFYDGLIDKDPTYKAVLSGSPHKERKSKFLQVDELRRLLSVLELGDTPGRDWMILLAAKTGARYAELLGLTPDDFRWETNEMTIDKTWDYKGSGGFRRTKTDSSVRTIAIDWQISGQFRPVIQDLPPHEPIFVPKNPDGTYKRIFNSTFNDHLERRCKLAGVTVISHHSLRHTHASVLLASSVSINSISKRLGHAATNVTQNVYSHLLDKLEEKDNQNMRGVMAQML